MDLTRKVKTALDETRLLILGAQVLFGFQLSSVFQDGFGELSAAARLLACAGVGLMALSVGLLIAPSMQHRIVEGGEDSFRIQRATSLFAGLALLPFSISLALGVHLIFDRIFGSRAALIAAALCGALAVLCWYGIEFAIRGRINAKRRAKPMPSQENTAPMPQKIEQMLTEARVILPGAQALFGFQFTMTLTRAFGELPELSKLIHVGALCSLAITVILLMTPAALHRLTYGGEDTAGFLILGSAFVIAAPAPLAVAIGGDLYVAISKASDSPLLGVTLAATVFVILAALWYALPLALRYRGARGRLHSRRA